MGAFFYLVALPQLKMWVMLSTLPMVSTVGRSGYTYKNYFFLLINS